jgi:hypothetical protein
MSDEEKPKPTGLLSEEERELIISSLKEMGAPKPCEMCGSANWVIGRYLVSPAPLTRANGKIALLGQDPLYVAAPLLCKVCGNTKLFNINFLGVRDKLLGPRKNKS